MFLKSINLTNFRTYAQLDLKFDQRPTIFIGDNATGKSNILEAIYLLSTTKSFRAETEDELIMNKEDFCRVEGFLDKPETELLVLINRPTEEVTFKKKVLINGIARRVVDVIGNLPGVFFHPSDINMVTGSPSLRRWHLDLPLAQIDSEYKRVLTQYEQFLTSRNRVLKTIREGHGKAEELEYWTEGVVIRGKIISKKRAEFFEFINQLKTPLGEFKFEYIQSPISEEKLKEINNREVAAATTLIGPHRDDFSILLDDRNISHFGSRGEQRTATLAFKLAQLEYMAKLLGKRPILLLDDVFSELDAHHRAYVVSIVSLQQTIIATVELENISKTFLNSARILTVKNGTLKED